MTKNRFFTLKPRIGKLSSSFSASASLHSPSLRAAQKAIPSFVSKGYSIVPSGAQRISTFGASVWTEFSPLAVREQAVNLGQGFPDWTPPDFVLNAAKAKLSITNSSNPPPTHALFGAAPSVTSVQVNQYARAAGSMNLVRSLASLYKDQFKEQKKILNALDRNIAIDDFPQIIPETDILPCNGASSALFLALQAHVNPGEEVILIEPFFE